MTSLSEARSKLTVLLALSGGPCAKFALEIVSCTNRVHVRSLTRDWVVVPARWSWVYPTLRLLLARLPWCESRVWAHNFMILGARSARLAPQPPPADGAQVYVVVVDRTAEGQASAPLRIEQLPAGCTRGELADRLHARAAAPAYLRVLVRIVYGFSVCQLPALQARHTSSVCASAAVVRVPVSG